MACTVVVGGFFGDTGKGKICSYLALKDKVALGIRAGAGPNAGHTVWWKGKEYRLRMIPSAFVRRACRLLIGVGVVIDPRVLLREVKLTNASNRLGVDKRCAIIEQRHIDADRSGHLACRIKTTGSGTGPCVAERALRRTKLASQLKSLRPYLTDVALEVNRALDKGKDVLIEGTQGTHLSLYHGTYPYCTSKDVTAAAACSDVGIGPTRVDEVIVVFKAYVTRVGAGPLKGEIAWEEAERRGWAEIATVTRRRRRAAPFDFELARRSVILNGATQAALTKLDVLFPECKGVDSFAELPMRAKLFVQRVERRIGVPITLMGTGPGVWEVVDVREKL
jgi:adenylosuccinate synthase